MLRILTRLLSYYKMEEVVVVADMKQSLEFVLG